MLDEHVIMSDAHWFFKEKLKTDIDTNDILIDTSFYC